jgi:hypothetical protein
MDRSIQQERFEIMIDYSKFSLMGSVSTQESATEQAARVPWGDTAKGQLLRGVATSVAASAISAWSSYNMDKIRARQQQSAVDHQQRLARIGRQQQAFRGAVHLQQVRQAQIQESAALQVQEMQTRAKLAAETADGVGPTFDRLQRVVKEQFRTAEFRQVEAQQAQRAAVFGEIAGRSAIGVGPVVERGTSGIEQVGSFLVDTIRIGRGR